MKVLAAMTGGGGREQRMAMAASYPKTRKEAKNRSRRGEVSSSFILPSSFEFCDARRLPTIPCSPSGDQSRAVETLRDCWTPPGRAKRLDRSEEHTSELQSPCNLV